MEWNKLLPKRGTHAPADGDVVGVDLRLDVDHVELEVRHGPLQNALGLVQVAGRVGKIVEAEPDRLFFSCCGIKMERACVSISCACCYCLPLFPPAWSPRGRRPRSAPTENARLDQHVHRFVDPAGLYVYV